MAIEIGDLFPQASGTAALGVEMLNGAPTTDIRPFATIHMLSGVFHAPYGPSGIIRFQHNTLDPEVPTNKNGIAFSLDGGKTYHFEISQGIDDDVQIGSSATNAALNIIAKHDLTLLAAQQIYLSAFGASGNMEWRGGPYASWNINNSFE